MAKNFKSKMLMNTLDNGLRYGVYSFPQLETIGIAIGVSYGSIDENPKINGSAHYLEHMLFKGTKKRGWEEISNSFKEMGAMSNAYTDFEETVYMLRIHKSYFDRSMEIISDMIINSTIPKDEFELERGAIINENLIRQNDPKILAIDELPKLLYKTHPARMPISGDNEGTIKKIKRDELFDIYQKNYTPKNMFISIYGGIKKSEAENLIKKYFGNFNRSFNNKKRFNSKEIQNKFEGVMERKGATQSRIAMGFKTGAFLDAGLEEYSALTLTTELLDYRIYNEIREKNGLSYDPGAGYVNNSTFGYIYTEAGLETKNIENAKKIMIKEFEKLQNNEVKKEEFERIKQSTIIKYKTIKDASLQSALKMSECVMKLGDINLFEKLPDKFESVELDTMLKYSNKYINADKYVSLILKPKK